MWNVATFSSNTKLNKMVGCSSASAALLAFERHVNALNDIGVEMSDALPAPLCRRFLLDDGNVAVAAMFYNPPKSVS